MLKEILINKMTIMILFVLTYFAPISSALAAMGVIIGIDFILGLIAANKMGIKITSNKMSQTIVKSLIYMLLIIAAFVINTTLVMWLPLVQITLSFLAITEFLSIAENFQKITGLSFVKYLKTTIQGYMKKHSDK